VHLESLGGVQLSATELVGLGEFPGFEPEHVGMRTRQEFSCANSQTSRPLVAGGIAT